MCLARAREARCAVSMRNGTRDARARLRGKIAREGTRGNGDVPSRLHERLIVTWRNVDAFRELFLPGCVQLPVKGRHVGKSRRAFWTQRSGMQEK